MHVLQRYSALEAFGASWSRRLDDNITMVSNVLSVTSALLANKRLRQPKLQCRSLKFQVCLSGYALYAAARLLDRRGAGALVAQYFAHVAMRAFRSSKKSVRR